MKIKIDKSTLNTLLRLENCLLLDGSNVLILKNIKSEKGIEKYGWKNRKERNVLYLTSCELKTYNDEGHFLGVHSGGVLEHFINYKNFNRLRNNFTNFHEQLKSFGFEIKKIEEPST